MQYALCPYCLSSLQITAEQLKQKDGIIRCGHCDEVFNAHDNQLKSNNDLVGNHLASAAATDQQNTRTTSPRAPWETPPSKAIKRSYSYGAIAAGLSILLLVQIGHMKPELITQQLALQPALKQINAALGLQIPLYKDINKIIIVERQISNHIDSNQAMRLQLSIKNTAAHEQPYPTIQLLLSSTHGEQQAYLNLSPSDYLNQHDSPLRFPAFSTKQIHLNFSKPHSEINGFEISFNHTPHKNL